jgi:hypothetical protein
MEFELQALKEKCIQSFYIELERKGPLGKHRLR